MRRASGSISQSVRGAGMSSSGGSRVLARDLRVTPLRSGAASVDGTSSALRSRTPTIVNRWRALATQPTASTFVKKKASGTAAAGQPSQQGQKTPPTAAQTPNQTANIYEVNEANFMAQVIEASDKRVVIVDCYADWCAPCKQLAPLLEAAVRNSGGRLALAKLNVDNNPNLAGQMQVASLPTVIAVSGRKMVDTFVGLLPPAEISQFVEGLLTNFAPVAPPEAEVERNLIEEAEAELASGNVNQAAAKFSEAMEKDKDQTHLAFAGLARCALQENNLKAAQHLVKELKDKFKGKLNDPAVGKAISAVELRAELADKSGGQDLTAKVGEWRDRLKQDPNDLEARYDLAHALFSTGQTEEALDQILDLIKRDKHWNDEAGRKLMLKIFSVLGNNNELTTKARQRFASIWFC